ncbi:MAG: hypothetical protein KKD73_01650 [Proteobacteria bacterium]|nr:hypothetical protein [Pseudomonadota bacterium]MBU1640075.1 hypothetical protein [Pseudomonadota bacterium]
MPDFTVKKPFILPTGATAATGTTVTITDRQAKYLLLAGKITPAVADKPRSQKSVTKKEN